MVHEVHEYPIVILIISGRTGAGYLATWILPSQETESHWKEGFELMWMLASRRGKGLILDWMSGVSASDLVDECTSPLDVACISFTQNSYPLLQCLFIFCWLMIDDQLVHHTVIHYDYSPSLSIIFAKTNQSLPIITSHYQSLPIITNLYQSWPIVANHHESWKTLLTIAFTIHSKACSWIIGHYGHYWD